MENTPGRDDGDELLPPRTVRKMFGVSLQSLRDWNAKGLLDAERTPGGHRRYRQSNVRALLAKLARPATQAVAT